MHIRRAISHSYMTYAETVPNLQVSKLRETYYNNSMEPCISPDTGSEILCGTCSLQGGGGDSLTFETGVLMGLFGVGKIV